MFRGPETDLNQVYLYLLNDYFSQLHRLPFTALTLGIHDLQTSCGPAS